MKTTSNNQPNWMEKPRQVAHSFFLRHSLPRWMVFALDASGIFITYIFSLLLRYNFELGEIEGDLAIKQALLVTAVYCGFELVYRSFAGLIRHTTIRDIFNVILATSSALIILTLISLLARSLNWNPLYVVPISILVIHFVTLNAVLFMSRILIKMFYEMVSIKSFEKKNIIIFGAGAMGVIIQRVIESDTNSEYNIIAFLDNNKNLQSKNLGRIPVFSPSKLSKVFLEKHGIDTMIFAIKDIPPNEKSDIYKFAVDLGLEVLEARGSTPGLTGSFNSTS